eukprot:TRINITY_DN12167_c0_g1_i1.p1 TRINITY_DN12167_c0_g1~~TRINITY_DN12167_c0_g1_i1.p1  ORF type:complete len:203 (+),score=20.90 TRINITY_DN12167_c0_g1_i1:390-998(+)
MASDVIAVKEHHHFQYSNVYPHLESQRAILISRDPFSTIESFYHYQQTRHTHALDAATRGAAWVAHVKEQTKAWVHYHKWWCNASTALGIPVFHVRYNDLKQHPVATLASVLRFLGFHIEQDAPLRAAEKAYHKAKHEEGARYLHAQTVQSNKPWATDLDGMRVSGSEPIGRTQARQLYCAARMLCDKGTACRQAGKKIGCR